MGEKWYGFFQRNRQLCDYIEQVHIREDSQKVLRLLLRKRIRIVVLTVLLLVPAWFYCWLIPAERIPLSDNRLTRQENDTDMELQVAGYSDGESWQEKMTISVGTRQFTKTEKEKLTRQVEQYLQEKLKQNNPSLKQVNRDILLPDKVPDTEIEISWTVDEEYLSDRGKLLYTNLPEGGVDTELMAKAEWKNWSDTFYFTVHLIARPYSEREIQVQQVKETLKKTVAEQKEKQEIILPRQIGNVRIKYAMEGDGKSYTLVYVLMLILILLPLIWRQQQKKELEARETQLLAQHPGLVNQFMLLLGAGLTVRKVVERLTEEYEQERKRGGKKRYAYEELCVMAREIKDGVSESKALEHFGKRCRLLPYLRFASVMTQNLKKGAEGILAILEKESLEAMERRKEQALQLGERAGTKLLFPMMLMLGIVIGIIMVPAFMTM